MNSAMESGPFIFDEPAMVQVWVLQVHGGDFEMEKAGGDVGGKSRNMGTKMEHIRRYQELGNDFPQFSKGNIL